MLMPFLPGWPKPSPLSLRMTRENTGPASALVVTALAFVLILWLHTGDTSSKFQGVLLVVSYWIPGLVAVTVIDWRIRTRGRPTINPAEERTERGDATAALVAFIVAYAAAMPFMNTSLFEGPVARASHGADTAYFVAFLVAGTLYGCYRFSRRT